MSWSRRSIRRTVVPLRDRPPGSGFGGAGPRADLARPTTRGRRGRDRPDRRAVEELVDHLAREDVVDRGARLDDQPMRERRLCEGLDVVRDHVVATEEPGEGLTRAVQRDGAPG